MPIRAHHDGKAAAGWATPWAQGPRPRRRARKAGPRWSQPCPPRPGHSTRLCLCLCPPVRPSQSPFRDRWGAGRPLEGEAHAERSRFRLNSAAPGRFLGVPPRGKPPSFREDTKGKGRRARSLARRHARICARRCISPEVHNSVLISFIPRGVMEGPGEAATGLGPR